MNTFRDSLDGLLRLTLTVLGGVSTTLGLVVACWWWADSHGKELFPAAFNFFMVVSLFVGLFARPLADQHQKRSEQESRRAVILMLLRAELERNRAAVAAFTDGRLADARWRIHPRLAVGAIDHAIATGGLAVLTDSALVNELLAWRDAAVAFNRRLELTEQIAFGPDGAQELPVLYEALRRPGGRLDDVVVRLDRLRERLDPVKAAA